MTRKTLRKEPPNPTKAELKVLGVLWERGRSTVREVFDVLGVGKGVGYTTVLKQMQVMHRKGLLVRSEDCRSHTYEPAFERSVTQYQLVRAVLQLAFDGSAPRLLRSALEGRRVGAQELKEIRQLLGEYD